MRRRGVGWVVLTGVSRLVVLGVIGVGALWPTYLNLLYAYNNERIVGLSHGPYWQAFYRAVGAVDAFAGTPQFLAHSVVGSPPALTLFGVPFIDPLVAVSLLVQHPSALIGLLAGLLCMVAAVLVFGRGYCSLACPASLFFEGARRLRGGIESIVPGLANLRRALPEGLRVGVLVGGTVGSVVSGIWVWQLLLPYLMVSNSFVSLVIGAPMGIAFTLFAIVLLVDFAGFPGEFCRALCPLGLLLGRVSPMAVVRLRAQSSPCPEGCQNCQAVCDLALNPQWGSVTDCNLCGRCAVVCPAQKLSIGLALPLRRHPRVVSSVTGAAVLALCLTVSTRVNAHHYHGLPHYGYFDNYPQTPTEEFIAGEGRWEMNFTLYNFQGMQRSDVSQPDDVQIFLVIFDLKEKGTFGGWAGIQIYDGSRLVTEWHRAAEQESIYFLHTQIPESDQLRMKVQFNDPQGKPVILSSPFHLPGQNAKRPWLWVGVGVMLLIVAVAFSSKQKRPVRRRAKEVAP